MSIREADAEVAKRQGGMLALFPRREDAERLAVPGFEPPEDLHVTLFYFGKDVRGIDPSTMLLGIDGMLNMFPTITARAFAHAHFNPDGEEPCAVLLIGDSDLIGPLKEEINEITTWLGGVELPKQHEPYIPHMTIGYDLDPSLLPAPGPIVFDRVALEWAGETYNFDLIDG